LTLTPNLVTNEQKDGVLYISYFIYEDLSTFYYSPCHKITTKAVLSETVSGCYDGQGSINII